MANGAQYLTGGGEGDVRQWFGVYYGYIAVNVDPTAKGRVKLRVPQVLGNATSGWALPMVAVSFVPQVSTPVSVMFVGGDPTQPVWFGNFALPIPPPVVIEAGAPVANGTQLGEIWYDSSDGMKTWEWNGASWIAYQLGTGGVASGIGLTEPSITGGTITGARFIADGTSGEFLGYTGSPVAGNMNVSVSPVAGTDGHTNAFLDGVTVYDEGAYLQIHVNSAFAAPAVEMVAGAASATLNPAIFGWTPNKGAANEYTATQWNGPRSSHDGKGMGISMFSSAKDGSGTPAWGDLWTESITVATWDDNGFHVPGTAYLNQAARQVGGFTGYPALSRRPGAAGPPAPVPSPLSRSRSPSRLATPRTPPSTRSRLPASVPRAVPRTTSGSALKPSGLRRRSTSRPRTFRPTSTSGGRPRERSRSPRTGRGAQPSSTSPRRSRSPRRMPRLP